MAGPLDGPLGAMASVAEPVRVLTDTADGFDRCGKAELTHGDDQWAKDMAQKVIDAQEQEIKDMKAWLAEQAS